MSNDSNGFTGRAIATLALMFSLVPFLGLIPAIALGWFARRVAKQDPKRRGADLAMLAMVIAAAWIAFLVAAAVLVEGTEWLLGWQWPTPP